MPWWAAVPQPPVNFALTLPLTRCGFPTKTGAADRPEAEGTEHAPGLVAPESDGVESEEGRFDSDHDELEVTQNNPLATRLLPGAPGAPLRPLAIVRRGRGPSTPPTIITPPRTPADGFGYTTRSMRR